MIIAIDGYSSTGKSSISKRLAKSLGYIHIDTGAMYRAVTLYGIRHCSKNGIIDMETLVNALPQLDIYFELDSENRNYTFLNGENIENEIRSISVSEKVSEIAKNKIIRDFLVEKQREMAKKGNIVMDGRDIGSVVFPNADFKFFFTANADIRALRRVNQLAKTGKIEDFETVKQNLILRDTIDSNRETSPLLQTSDAIEVDTSHRTKEETFAFLMDIVGKK